MLTGSGFIITNQNKYAKKTIIVLGIARGGTSLAAGILHSLGIPMGNESSPPIFEDDFLTRAIRNKWKWGQTHEIIANYNSKFDVWGYKKPSVQNWIVRNYQKFRNPVFVFVMKDPLAISLRKTDLYGYDPKKEIKNILTQYEKIMDFLIKRNLCAFIFSYEKMLKNYLEIIPSLCDFLDVSNEKAQKAVDFINHGSNSYNQFFFNQIERKKNAIEGHLDLVDKNTIAGWAVNLSNPIEPITVSVTLNDNLILSVKANDYRQDLFESGKHPTGYCGYTINLQDNDHIINGSIIRVFAGDSKTELSRSPWIFNAV